jgi:outer membrane protein TolC
MLNITLGLEINNPTVLTDTLESLTEQNIALNLLDANETIENSIDYLIAENDKRSKELLLKYEKSKALPTLDAFINGGYSAFSDTFTFTDKDQKWFGSSLFGVSLNIPIFSSLGRSAATQRAKINLEKSQDDLLETQQRIELQIASAKSNYQFAIDDFDNKKQNLQLAERIEAKNQTKFFEGIASSFDLRQAQLQLYTAQQEYLQAMFDIITNKTELETILNTPSY